MHALEEITVTCPYCSQVQTCLVDVSGGDQQYIEDCEVCCSPILFDVHLDAAGQLLDVKTRRENE